MHKQDAGIKKHGEEIEYIFNALKRLLDPPQVPRKRIGYKIKSE